MRDYLNRIIIKTDDNSSSIFIPELNENYHSTHGAIQESNHIYIKNGFEQIKNNHINIFEVGFGTGLNTILTYINSKELNKTVNYYAVEKYPLNQQEIDTLNYNGTIINKEVYDLINSNIWNSKIIIDKNFSLIKYKADIKTFETDINFDLVYFDAFAPDVQPKLWSKEIFNNIYNQINIGGILVTYSVKGEVKRLLKSIGFKVEIIDGPPGKRHMLRAIK